VSLPRTLAPAAYAALAATDTALAASASPTVRRFRLVTKPLLMPALGTAFAASLGDTEGGGLLRGGTVLAQGMSGLGDIALLNKSEPAFLAGLGSFFGAHVAYTTAFASAGRPWRDRSDLGGTLGAAGLLAATAPLMGWAAGRKSATLRAPVVAYSGVLCAMFAASTRLDPDVPESTRRTLAAGTALFLASDTILGLREFVLPRRTPLTDAAVMATYTAGQGLIALGVSRAVRHRVARQAALSSRPSGGPRDGGTAHPTGTAST
jgi:uncharacterized membrane protein YhhN